MNQSDNMEHLVRILFIAGSLLIIAGIILLIAGNKLQWLGHLPGDIRIEKENLRIYIPITTMIILSIVVSVVVFLVKRFFQS